MRPKIPPDEDEILHARRLIAQRCLYGVDRNPMAVDLAKLSLWLATLAKDHPFTFLDHSLRCGDSLVGLTRDQIAAFHWQPKKQMEFLEGQIGKRIARATEYRRQILAARDDVPYEHLRQMPRRGRRVPFRHPADRRCGRRGVLRGRQGPPARTEARGAGGISRIVPRPHEDRGSRADRQGGGGASGRRTSDSCVPLADRVSRGVHG